MTLTGLNGHNDRSPRMKDVHQAWNALSDDERKVYAIRATRKNEGLVTAKAGEKQLRKLVKYQMHSESVT